ncbi:aspartate/glutamate racemase family protein [Phenylobacterium sp.]|uniref:aspartate/glutamate racemase family protein n=1 Tax=Phenylobacterium sp. TaxID=1871053 RepID=UPI0027304213|nr:aspartate/glutamate racemase family protein [Phenylobacterium sp.]MDP1618638.1 aspartate/glutamate racemase family protein [Phenylobacterium sp.]MDP1987499.1 aspartate/glutamate racemase family protein [Phenylobacterium sp.]
MRRLGLIGGMSAESTTTYYQLLNQGVRARLGGLHSAELLLWSVDFAPVAQLQAAGDWATAGAQLAQAAHVLERAGAEAVMICANTMHLVADEVAAAVSVPLIHIGDATAQALVDQGLKRPLLLATRFTMEETFYRGRLESFGLDPMIPGEGARERLHAIIYDELCQGVIDVGSRTAVMAIIERGRAEGADSVIFGCTELGLLLDPDSVGLPVVDSALAHVGAALDFALAEPA